MTVQEVAKKLGVSDVTIYNKLKLNQFKDKVVIRQGSKAIDDDLFNLIKDSLNLNKNFNSNLNQDEDKNYKSSKNKSSSDDLSLINLLTNQLNIKDQQIAQLTQMLADANAKRDEHAAYISKLLENEQVLRGHKEGIPIKNNSTDADETAVGMVINEEQTIETVKEENEQPKKKWWKIF